MSKLKRYRENILQFVVEEFQATPDKWQELGLLAFASDDPKTFRISLQACAGPGKSTLLCWCGWWFLLVMGDVGEHPKAAAVSITSDNLKDNLWSEMSKWQSRSTLLMQAFEWTQTRIYAKDHPNTWFMAARGFAQTADTEAIGRTLSGLHSKYVLYLIDESGDIPPSIIKSAEQGLSTKPIFGKILQAGNPTSHDGMLYAAATVLRDQWHIIRITGDPDDVNRSPRIDIEWARTQIVQYGRDNPWVKAFILGEFPSSAINTLLSLSEIEAAINRQIHETTYNWAQKRLGVDVARFGSDDSCIFPRQGLRAFKPLVLKGLRSNEVAARVAHSKNKWKSEMEFVDGTGGYGSGVVDALLQAGHSPTEVNFSSVSPDPKYFNMRSYMWFMMAQWIKRGATLPNDSRLIKELAAPQYSFTNGRFQLESKEQIKKRLGFSPDLADALCLTFAMPEYARTDDMKLAQIGSAHSTSKVEYDPMDFNKESSN